MTATPLRLPGSVAEVDASPEGPHVGAFFDLDGTLVALVVPQITGRSISPVSIPCSSTMNRLHTTCSMPR